MLSDLYGATCKTLDRIHTFAVSHPIPVFPPVTTVTFPERSGISFAVNLVLGGNDSFINEGRLPMLAVDERGLKLLLDVEGH